MVNATECSTTSTSSCEAYSKENKENCDQSKVASNGPVEIIDIDEDSREEADAKRSLSFPDKKHGNPAEDNPLFSPPRKKLKQGSVAFPTISKDEAAKRQVEEIGLLSPKSSSKRKDSEKDRCKNKQDALPFKAIPKEEAEAAMLKELKKVEIPTEESASSTPNKPDDKVCPSADKEDASLKSPPHQTKSAKGKKKLTPENQKQKEMRQKELEEKKKKKEEEKLQRQAEKEKKEQERKEKERLREEEKKKKEEDRKKKEEEKEADRKKKEEEKRVKDLEKQAEKEKKEEERKQKEEEKRLKEEKKEEERKLKEEEKRLAEEKRIAEEEAERKKKEKAAQAFKSFFKPKKVLPKKEIDDDKKFKMFQLKPGMTLAPTVRRKDWDKHGFDKCFNDEEDKENVETYLALLSKRTKSGNTVKYISRRRLRKQFEEEKKKQQTDDIVVVETKQACDENDDDLDDSYVNEKSLYPAIFLQFSENTRPAYYGTWRKKSLLIKGRRPFKMEEDLFNYDIDSDEDWVDEPGESLSDANDDEEGDIEVEDEDDQDGFFVPHGYLSDDEGIKDDSDGEDADDEGEGQAKEKLKSAVTSMDVEIRRKLKPRKPICFGLVFSNNADDLPPYLQGFEKVDLFKAPGTLDDENTEDVDDAEASKSDTGKLKSANIRNGEVLSVPEVAMPFLIKYVHGNTKGLPKLCKGFREFWPAYTSKCRPDIRGLISKRQLEFKIKTIASFGMLPGQPKQGYLVSQDVLDKYGLTDITLGMGLPDIDSLEEAPSMVEDMDASDSLLSRTESPSATQDSTSSNSYSETPANVSALTSSNVSDGRVTSCQDNSSGEVGDTPQAMEVDNTIS